jgi:hypothetical protein
MGVRWFLATAIALNGSSDHVLRLIPGGAPSLAQLSDDELLANTRRLVGKSNQLMAALLLHLAEVETRGVHRSRCCASLYTYCIYELRFSEDAAARRSAAARFVKQFPALLDAIAAGELHLTGLLMIGPHLTPQNEVEVLGRAKFRTKKELAKLVRELNPLPGLPDSVEPLGPQRVVARRNPRWGEWHAPPVRELPEGERPSEWVEREGEGEREAEREGERDRESEDRAGDRSACAEALPVGRVPANLPPITVPQQYGLQFTTVEEHVRLIEKAKALLARERPGVTLGELHLEAMRAFVAGLEKRKFKVLAPKAPRSVGDGGAPHPRGTDGDYECDTSDPRQRGESENGLGVGRSVASEPPRQRGAVIAELGKPKRVRDRSRHIPAAVQREVYERDGGCCTYVDAQGARCGEMRFLELHHVDPFGKGGGHRSSNLALRCAAHNALAAEEDFGKEHVAKRRDAGRHDSLARALANERRER